VLHEAANTANSDLAAEAAQLLDTLPDSKQGATQQASFTAFKSSGDGRWSNGNLRWGKEHGLSVTLKCLDFGDQLPISPELSEMLGGVTGAQEIRQCVILHLAVALLWKKGGNPPSAAAVIALATELRVEMAGKAWEAAKEMIANPEYAMVILDEINIALRYEYLPIGDVLEGLAARPHMLHVVATGRNAHDDMIESADLVTEMTLIKHPFRSGIKAQEGVEF